MGQGGDAVASVLTNEFILTIVMANIVKCVLRNGT